MKKIFLTGLIVIGLIGPIGLICRATTIVDGDLIRAQGNIDVYIVKIIGAEEFKRLILNPEIFNQYGHLKWENIKTVVQTELDKYITSDLVRANDDEKVYKLYPNGDVGEKRWIKTAEDFSNFGYKPSAIYEINNFERDFYNLGEDLTYQAPVTPPTPPARTNNITINVPADYSTIQAAIGASINGDTIIVASGTYKENIVINKSINLIGAYYLSVIIDGQGNGPAITVENVDDFKIQKITIKSQNQNGIYCDGSSKTKGTIKNAILRDAQWGVYAEKNCDLAILNNIIYNNRSSDNKDGGGIWIKDNLSYSISPEIRNNTIDDNHHGIIIENSKAKILNNIVTRNMGSGTSTGIYLKGGQIDNSYNDVWGNGFDYQGGVGLGDGSIFGDPRFVNAPERNYRLIWGSSNISPCIDTGSRNTEYDDGKLLTGTVYRNDMGAYGGPDNINWGL